MMGVPLRVGTYFASVDVRGYTCEQKNIKIFIGSVALSIGVGDGPKREGGTLSWIKQMEFRAYKLEARMPTPFGYTLENAESKVELSTVCLELKTIGSFCVLVEPVLCEISLNCSPEPALKLLKYDGLELPDPTVVPLSRSCNRIVIIQKAIPRTALVT